MALNPFDGAYAQYAERYAAKPFWLYEAAQLLQATRVACCDSRVLDVGCSTGDMLAVFDRLAKPALVCGIDVNADAVAIGRVRHPAIDLRVVRQGAAYPLADRSFDVVVSLHTLGHVEDPAFAAREMVRVLERKGRLAIIVPNRRYYQARYIGRAAPGDPTQRHQWSPRELSRLFDAAKLQVDRVSTFGRAVPLLPGVKARILLEGRRSWRA